MRQQGSVFQTTYGLRICAMSVRNMIYDALNYGYQVKATGQKHRREKDTKTKDEFLSGFTSEDKIIPVITINDIAGTRIPLNEKGEVVNMCKAWEEQYEDGVENGKREAFFSLVSDGTLTLEVAVEKSGMSNEDFVKGMEVAGYKIPVEA